MSASARISYITRTPAHELSRAEQQLRYIQEGREDLIYTRSRNLPAWSHDTAHVYFQAAERHEGTNRVAFTELKISLPVELSHRENMALMHDLVDAIAGDHLPVTYAFHDPTTLDGAQQQPHLHLLVSSRRTDEYARTAETHFKRYNRAEPWRGGAEKDPASWHLGAVRAQRQMVSDILNVHLARAGVSARIDPRSLEAREIARQPEPKLLPSESRQYREHGIVSATMQQVLMIRAERTQHAEAEHVNARQYWAARQDVLGITPDMSMDQQLAHIRAYRQQAITHAPERRSGHELDHEAQTLTHTVAGLEQYVQDIQSTQRLEQRLAQSHGPYEWRQMRDAEQILAEGTRHGLPRDREAEKVVAQLTRYLASQEQTPQVGEALRVRLYRDREQDRGMSW